MIKNKNVAILGIIIIVILISILMVVNQQQGEHAGVPEVDPIKIGVITPLSGTSVYWGNSTVVGINLASQELAKENVDTKFIFEDGQLDAHAALSAAQKLVTVDGVTAIYSEFAPAAISVTSFTKDRDVIHIYDAAPVSPLVESENVYKSYLDFETSCREVSQLLRSRGIERVGVLKAGLEFGELCKNGIVDVYGSNAFIESYNVGDNDFATPLAKLQDHSVQAIFNATLQPDTLASLQDIESLDMDITFVALSEMFPEDIIDEYSPLLEGSILFGLPQVSEDFIDQINTAFPDAHIANYHAAALGYMHAKQLAYAFNSCGTGNLECVREYLDTTPPDPVIQFQGFDNHVAKFDTLIQEFKDGRLVDIR